MSGRPPSSIEETQHQRLNKRFCGAVPGTSGLLATTQTQVAAAVAEVANE